MNTIDFSKDFYSDNDENIKKSIFEQYEKIIVETLITSFGLDFLLIKDQHGGDVDTIHNVRKIGIDSEMEYKNSQNKKTYENKEEYNSNKYHSHQNYKDTNKEVSTNKKNGTLYDSYTGEKISINGKTDLDHIMSAKEIHEDRGRILAELNGTDLANSPDNLTPTNPRTNRTKKADSMNKFIEKYEDEYTPEQIKKMKAYDVRARKNYEAKIARKYYTSSKFASNVSLQAGKLGVTMGLRQALGFVFTEIWFGVKDEFEKIGDLFSDLSNLFLAIGRGIKNGFNRAKEKYKEIFSKFITGAVAGALSSITTTICNIFFTTAKNIIKIIRQTYASLVQAIKILFLNPDNLPFGERIRVIVKILSTAASVVIGTVINEAISKTPIGQIPIIGEIVSNFCGVLTTGILSCSILYFFDNNSIIQKVINFLNTVPTFDKNVAYFKDQVVQFESYAAELMKIDIVTFKKETSMYTDLVANIDKIKNPTEMNYILKNILNELGVQIPWEESHNNFNDFMNDSDAILIIK